MAYTVTPAVLIFSASLVRVPIFRRENVVFFRVGHTVEAIYPVDLKWHSKDWFYAKKKMYAHKNLERI